MKKSLVIFFSLCCICGIAQKKVMHQPAMRIGVKLPATIIGKDTIGVVDMDYVTVCGHRVFANCTEAANYYILEQNVKTVLPYALLAQAEYAQCEQTMSTIASEHEKKKYLKQVEKQMMDEYEQELKNLTVSQGKLLIKLIDRQTGQTSYDMVKEMKGSISAFMWQTVATFFGNSMKDTYDPNGEDRDIENIINLIEQGQI